MKVCFTLSPSGTSQALFARDMRASFCDILMFGILDLRYFELNFFIY